jgi:ABC-type sugar transport system ATPase subunit
MLMTATASVDRGVVLSLRGVSKSFGAQRALDSVDLEIVAGEIHAVVG